MGLINHIRSKYVESYYKLVGRTQKMTRPIKIGDRITIIGNSAGHNYTLGKTYIVASVGPPYIQATDPKTKVRGNNLNVADVKLCPISLIELKREGRDLAKQLKIVKAKIDYLTETGGKTLDESEWSVTHAFNLLDEAKPQTRQERVVMMTKIMKDMGIL
jgi:hypothetical protein